MNGNTRRAMVCVVCMCMVWYVYGIYMRIESMELC